MKPNQHLMHRFVTADRGHGTMAKKKMKQLKSLRMSTHPIPPSRSEDLPHKDPKMDRRKSKKDLKNPILLDES